MAFIPIRKPWTQQPQQAVEVDWGNPLCSRITHLLPLNGSDLDIVTGARLTAASGGIFASDERGLSLRGNGSAACASTPLDLSAYTFLTISFWMYWDAWVDDDDFALEFTSNTNTTNGGIAFNPNDSSGLFGLYTRVLSGANGKYSRFARPSASAWHHYMVTVNRGVGEGVGGYTVFVDGAQASVTDIYTSAGDGTGFANSTLYLFSRNNSSLFGAGRMQNLVFRGGYLGTAEDARAEYSDPWQLFAPLQRRITASVTSSGNTIDLTVTSFGVTPRNPQATLRGEIGSKSFPLSPQTINTLRSQSLNNSSVNVTTQSFNMQELARLNSTQVSFLARDIDYILGSSDVELLTAVLNISTQAIVAKLLSTLTTTTFDADVQSIRTALLNSLSSSAFNIDINSIDTPFVLTLDSGPINMMMFLKLGMLGFTGTINDRLKAFFENDGALGESLSDLEYDWLRRVKGISPGALNDMWMRFTGSFGYTGAINDRVKAYWFNL